jgi:hypothetical protein
VKTKKQDILLFNLTYTDCEDSITIRMEVYLEKINRWLVEKNFNLKFDFNLIDRYSTLIVKYSWCFLLLGTIICIALGLSGIFLHDLPDFNDPTKVKNFNFVKKKKLMNFFLGFYSTW